MVIIAYPFVSIILTNYNGKSHIKECLDSIKEITYKNYEIIFVDNNSSDNSVDFVKENYPEVKIIQNENDLGFTGANNIGAALSKGEFIVLLNIDTVVDKNWLKEMVKVAKSSEKIGVVGSKIYYYNHKDLINFAGAYTNKFGEARHIGLKKIDSTSLNIKRKSFYICGASLLFRRELFERFGLFDSIYYGYYEDVDFCWRAWICGYNVIYVPSSIVYHKIGVIYKDSELRVYLTERNKLRTILKNYEIRSLMKVLPKYFYNRILEIYGLRVYKNKFSYKKFMSLLKTVSWNFIHLFSLIKNRIFVQKNRIRDDKFLFHLMEELIQYKT